MVVAGSGGSGALVSESSQDSLQSGNAQTGSRTARVILLQQCPESVGVVWEVNSVLVEDVGTLIKGDILQFMTVGQVRNQ